MVDNQQLPNDEITIREIIILVQDYLKFFWSKKWLILLVGLLGAAFFFYRQWKAPVNYSTELTFMVNEDSKGGIPGVGSILGQFGLGGGGADHNLEKIKELSRSRKIVQNVLFDTILMDGKEDFIANHLIDSYGYHESWAKADDSLLVNFYFKDDTIRDFNRTENTVLKALHYRVIGEAEKGSAALINIDHDPVTGILTMSGQAPSEVLTLEMVNKSYQSLSEFYISRSTERQKVTLERLNFTVDSVFQELSKVEYSLARFRDRSASLIQRRDQLQESNLMRRQQVLNVMYGEALRNRETSAFVLNSETPYFQAIDVPIAPLYTSSKSYVSAILKGGLLGGILIVFILVIVRIYGTIMSDTDK